MNKSVLGILRIFPIRLKSIPENFPANIKRNMTYAKIQRISGIQKKYLINIVLLLALALLLSSVGVGIYVRKNMSNVVLDKYEFMTEKMGITL